MRSRDQLGVRFMSCGFLYPDAGCWMEGTNFWNHDHIQERLASCAILTKGRDRMERRVVPSHFVRGGLREAHPCPSTARLFR